jgi:peptidoglycan/LPS O-acetylase OafA/YrhL
MSSIKYRPDIDGLRAVAVGAVVLFHAFPNLAKGGFVGVDVFFVISGFLISSIILEGFAADRFSYLEFYARRIRRIFPALTVVCAISLLLGWYVLLPDEFRQLGKHTAAGAAFVSNFAFWNEAGYFSAAADTKPLLHLWSLGIEEQFYIAWPLALGLLWKWRQRLFLVTLAVAALSFAVNIATLPESPVAAFYSPLSRFWELAAGGALAQIALLRPALLTNFANARSLAGILLIAVAVFELTINSAFPGYWALLPTLGALLIISAGPDAWLNRYVLGNKIAVSVGLSSVRLKLE